MGLPDQWDACSRTILLEGKSVAEVFAFWGDIIAVVINLDVMLFHAITGITTSVLRGHRDRILSLAFSLDGTLLVSKSNDMTIKLWDIQTGGVVRNLVDANSIHSISSAISISPDGTTIASGTRDGAIHLWDVRTGKCHSIETHQRTGIETILFSPVNSRRLLSASLDGHIQQWDVGGHQIGTFHHEGGRVRDLAFTLDGTRFVSCGGVVTVRDTESGAVVVTFKAPGEERTNHCCFSPDGRSVACATTRYIYVWDITKPEAHLTGHLAGHGSSICFIAFPSYLVSGAQDRSVKFWQSRSPMADPGTTKHMATEHGSGAIIQSVGLFAGDNTVVTGDDRGVVKAWDLTTGRCKKSFQTPVPRWSSQDTHLAGDTFTTVWWESLETKYLIWVEGKGQVVRKVHSSFNGVRDIKIAGDGSKVFGLSDGCVEARSIETGEEVGRVSLADYDRSSLLIVRGSKVEYGKKKGWGWDFGGPEVSDYGELLDRPRLDLVDWSDGKRILPRWIEDTVTKRPVFRLPETLMRSNPEVLWDGRYLIICSSSGELAIMDLDSICPR